MYCDDSVGARYATALRDLIAGSPRFALVSEEDWKTAKPSNFARLTIHVSTLDPDTPSAGRQAAIAWALTSDGIYVTASLQICGSNVITVCAEQTVSKIDQYVEGIYNN